MNIKPELCSEFDILKRYHGNEYNDRNGSNDQVGKLVVSFEGRREHEISLYLFSEQVSFFLLIAFHI